MVARLQRNYCLKPRYDRLREAGLLTLQEMADALHVTPTSVKIWKGNEWHFGMKGKPVKWRVAAKRGKIKAMQEGPLKDLVIAVERTKAQIRARVEHPFHVVKNLFRHRKVRYKGLAKNTAQLFSLFALANLVIAKNQLLSTHESNP